MKIKIKKENKTKTVFAIIVNEGNIVIAVFIDFIDSRICTYTIGSIAMAFIIIVIVVIVMITNFDKST